MAFLKASPIDVAWLQDRDWWRDVERGAPDACWPWLKSTASHGYGQTWDGTTVRLAHRVAWALTYGAIPADLTIDHLCHNRVCCNPAHLRLLSNVENATANQQGTKTHCPRGHPYEGDNLKTYTNPKGQTCRKCRACQSLHNAARHGR